MFLKREGGGFELNEMFSVGGTICLHILPHNLSQSQESKKIEGNSIQDMKTVRLLQVDASPLKEGRP